MGNRRRRKRPHCGSVLEYLYPLAIEGAPPIYRDDVADKLFWQVFVRLNMLSARFLIGCDVIWRPEVVFVPPWTLSVTVDGHELPLHGLDSLLCDDEPQKKVVL